MRLWSVALLVSILAVPLQSQTDPSWRDALERAQREKKPILVFERPARCATQRRCADFEKLLNHPGVQRRLAEVVFVTRPISGPPEVQVSDLVLHDRRGTPVAKLGGLPADNTVFAAMLDGIASARPNLENAAVLAETNGPYEGELELATALYILGRNEESRAAIERARVHGSASTREMAIVALAMLDANGPKRAEALQSLQKLAANASNPEAAATAWMGIATIHRGAGEMEEARQAYTKAIELAPLRSGTRASASEALASLQPAAVDAPQSAPIRIIPPQEQIVTGPQRILTTVSSTDVARVVFTVDGEQKASIDRPPFSATVDFGRIPQARTIRAVAFNVKGKEIGRHEVTVNHAGDLFWLRLIEPRAGNATGNVRVTATMRAPAGRNVKRVVVSWNDAERAVITREPWQADVRIPSELGILRAVAELDDGRTTEDAVLLNTTGYVEHSNATLVELPVTITADGAPVRVTTKDVTIREGRTKRAIESVISGSDAPLTVGLVFDTSGSMYKNLLDVQEAAVRFLDTALGANDRAFVITFDSTARLIQTPTSDRALLRDRILALRTQGDTALYDAMILGLLQFEGIKGRRAMIVFSDGDDRVSRYETKHVEDLAGRSNIPIYLIAAPPTARPFGNAPTRAAGANSRDNFSLPPSAAGDSWSMHFAGFVNAIRATGGHTHSLRNLAELPAVYEKIAAALRAQSLIVIRSDPGRSENDWRPINVAVAGRNREVRAPAGYYAPW